jgi:hypothetical protein
MTGFKLDRDRLLDELAAHSKQARGELTLASIAGETDAQTAINLIDRAKEANAISTPNPTLTIHGQALPGPEGPSALLTITDEMSGLRLAGRPLSGEALAHAFAERRGGTGLCEIVEGLLEHCDQTLATLTAGGSSLCAPTTATVLAGGCEPVIALTSKDLDNLERKNRISVAAGPHEQEVSVFGDDFSSEHIATLRGEGSVALPGCTFVGESCFQQVALIPSELRAALRFAADTLDEHATDSENASTMMQAAETIDGLLDTLHARRRRLEQ